MLEYMTECVTDYMFCCPKLKGKGLDSSISSMKRDRMPSPEKTNESGSNGGLKWPRWKQWSSNKGEYQRDPLEVQPPWIDTGSGSSCDPPVGEDPGLVLPQSNTNRIKDDQEFENSTYEAMRVAEVFHQAVNTTLEAIQMAVDTTFEASQGSGGTSSEGGQEGTQVYWDRNGRWEEWGGD